MDMGSPPKKRLGRGLAALIGEDTSEESVVQDVRSLRHMPIDLLKASPNNPRKTFAEADLEDLANLVQLAAGLRPVNDRQVLLKQLTLQRLREQVEDEVDLRVGEGDGDIGHGVDS